MLISKLRFEILPKNIPNPISIKKAKEAPK